MTKTEQKQILERKKKILERKAEIEQQLLIDSAKNNYADYVRLTHSYDPEFNIAPFQVYICDCIDKLLKNELLNENGEPYEGITISLPPQHGKSSCVSETLPSYFLGEYPYRHVIEASYNEDFAEKFGRRNKEKIDEFGKLLFDIEISKDKTSAVEFELARTKGGMLSKGFTGGISGAPGDLIIVDDPYKNMSDADSPSYSAEILENWKSVLRMRASAKCKFVVIHTRWNEDDLIGYLLSVEPEKWFEIKFPLECEEPEEITGRQPGDALLPEAGKDNAWLKKFKTSFMNDPLEGGVRAWNALCQQRPTNIEGNMIKRRYWKRYKLSLEMRKPGFFEEIIQSWDCTFKDTDGTDFVAGHVWARKGPNCYFLDRAYDRMDIIKTMSEIEYMIKKWPEAMIKLIEDKANGPAVISMLRRKIPGLVPSLPKKSKGERVNSVLPLWEGGNVWIPSEIEVSPGIWETCTWANEVIELCAGFRPEKKVQKDDDVDAASQALQRYIHVLNYGEYEEGTPTYTDDEDDDEDNFEGNWLTG